MGMCASSVRIAAKLTFTRFYGICWEFLCKRTVCGRIKKSVEFSGMEIMGLLIKARVWSLQGKTVCNPKSMLEEDETS
jgi:hypothetical protein